MIDKLCAGAIGVYSAVWVAVAGNQIIIDFTAALWRYRHALEAWMQ